MRNNRYRLLIEVVGLFLVLSAIAGAVWKLTPDLVATANRPRASFGDITTTLLGRNVSLRASQQKGNSNAKVAVVEFSDYECPFCGEFASKSLPDLMTRYVDTGQILWVVKNLPLSTIHPYAKPAAETAECAAQQGKFWPMHDALFKKASELDPAGLDERAKAVGLDISKYALCISRGDARLIVDGDVKEAARVGIQGTPTFLLGTMSADESVNVRVALTGMVPSADFGKQLDALLHESAELRCSSMPDIWPCQPGKVATIVQTVVR